MWEFSIGLILLDLHPESLALVALFGLIDSLAQVLAGPFVGAYIDRHAIPSHVSHNAAIPAGRQDWVRQ